jgi:hypothetical protein
VYVVQFLHNQVPGLHNNQVSVLQFVPGQLGSVPEISSLVYQVQFMHIQVSGQSGVHQFI